nr:hypothetical protein [Tanacetum cinerariifolium]
MSTQQDIYTAGSENRLPMLNKENYVPWSSRLLCDQNRELPVNETFHKQTDDELNEKELKQVATDDQAIQTILLGLPEDIYAAVDSCETAQKIWLHFQQMMKGSDIGIQEKKTKLFNEWESTYMQQPQPNNSYSPQPSFNQNYMQQPMLNPEGISDPITTMNMALVLMAKNSNGNGNAVAARAEGNATGNNDGSAEVHNYDNCYDNEIFSMFTQEEQYTELLEPIPEPHQVLQNNNNVIYEVSSVEQDGRTVDQHPVTVEETCADFESLYNNLEIKVDKVMNINKKTKTKPKRTKPSMEWKSVTKSKSKSKSTVKDEAKAEEILNGPTRTHLMGRVSPLSIYALKL